MHNTYPYRAVTRPLNPLQYVEAIEWCMEHSLRTSAVWKGAGCNKLVRIGHVWTQRLYTACKYSDAQTLRGRDPATISAFPRAIFFRDVADATLFKIRYS